MEQKELIELELKSLKDFHVVQHNEHRFVTSHFGFVNSFAKIDAILFSIGQPYRIKEGRILIVTKGAARLLIDLMEHTIYAGYVSVITPNSIIQITQLSPDFDLQMIAVDKDFLSNSGKEDFFSYVLHHQRNTLFLPDAQEQEQIAAYFKLTWNILQESSFRRPVIQHLLASLLSYIECITQNGAQANSTPLTHQESIFQQFISLVNAHSKSERNVSFYAGKLCLTPRYLNTVIRQASHQTVMDWINQSIILEAKVLLKHSNLLVYQISDELNFPNPSFFCKFFKRITGMTPQEYQKLK